MPVILQDESKIHETPPDTRLYRVPGNIAAVHWSAYIVG